MQCLIYTLLKISTKKIKTNKQFQIIRLCLSNSGILMDKKNNKKNILVFHNTSHKNSLFQPRFDGYLLMKLILFDRPEVYGLKFKIFVIHLQLYLD